MKKTLLIAIAFALILTSCCGNNTPRTIATPSPTDTLLMSIYAFDGHSERVFGIPNMGHAFVAIQNLSDRAVSLGAYQLSPSEEVTISTWGQREHWGIWYNLEAQYFLLGRYKGAVSITRAIGQSELTAIANYLKTADYWTPFTNCSAFSISLWNMTAGDNSIEVFGVTTPAKLRDQITRFDTHKTDRAIVPLRDACYQKNSRLIFCPIL